jgi:hypothetical protein
MELFDKKYGLPQNVDMLCFGENSLLGNEYDRLYRTLFADYQNHHLIVGALSKKRKGLTRQELIEATKISNGGFLTKILNDLEHCGFIKMYYAFGKKKKDALYQLIDSFTLFYHNFMADGRINDESYWTNGVMTAKHSSWSGYAFEMVCLLHIKQIRKALGIAGVSANYFSWRSASAGSASENMKDMSKGAQVDLVIERRDQVINLCEMKYSVKEFKITKAYYESLKNKEFTFISETGTKSALHTTLISTYGVKDNKYKPSVQSEVTMDDLFDI